MSHYIYKKKAFIELGDGRILPLCLYADSSISSYNFDRLGRKHYFHPKSWGINTMGQNQNCWWTNKNSMMRLKRHMKKNWT